MPNSLLIVLHGKQAGNPGVRSGVAELRRKGHQVAVRVTWEPGDARRFVDEAVAGPFDTVVAGGGDGTINEVVDALVAAGERAAATALGILPLGTANDFARANQIPLDPQAALDSIVRSQAVAIDVGRAGDRSFVNVATGGFGTQVTVETPEDLKRALGGAAYLLTGLRRFNSIRSMAGRFRGPDFAWQGNFLVLAVGNGRQAGGGHVLCPDARLDDGLLDVTILPEVDPGELPNVLGQLLRTGVSAIEQIAIRTRLPWLECDSETPVHINLDGEPIADTHIRFEVVPRSIRARLPRTDLLLEPSTSAPPA